MRWWWHAPCALKATAPPGNWQNRLIEPVVPLSKIQSAVLRLLAAHRGPESDIAGATPLNWNTARDSDDIDVFHDREEGVAAITPALYRRGAHTATPAHAWNGSWTAITGLSQRCALRPLVCPASS